MNERCDAVRARVFEHRRGELGEPEALLVEEHLAACAECAAFEGRAALLLGAPAPRLERAAALWERIEAALPEARRARRSRWPWLAVASALVALALGPGEPSAASIPEPTAASAIRATEPTAPTAEPTAPTKEPTAATREPSADEAPDAPPPPPSMTPMTPMPPKAPRLRVARAPVAPPAPTGPPTPATPAVPPTPTPATPTPATPTPVSPLVASDELLRASRPRDAIAVLEDGLARGTLTGPGAATAHLELARLYGRETHGTRSAVAHLRVLLRDHPDDPAAASVFRELCRLAALGGLVEPMCPVSLVEVPAPALGNP